MMLHQIGGLGYDSNMYLIIDDVVTLIDAGTGQNFKIVRQNLEKLGLKPSDIELLINTHCHFDHTGGDVDFLKAGCEIAIYESEAALLRKGDRHVTMAHFFGVHPEPLEVARELHDGDRIELGSSVLEVIHTPGHTQGSICLYEPRLGALFSGDTVFYGDVGRTDLPTGDYRALAKSLKKLAELRPKSLYPGHGPSADDGAHEVILSAIELI
ncbi:MAG: MBL fold metallo-hydrolase [Candidatus Hadarchaeum sp.]|uniref:MBL fold metallo-hydrolase n=1 Tax=Candidatus Hadarchaeum sp. TaxID=2883567 RepID=UPI0031804B78